MHALLEGTASDWINRSGKLLLFLAGLAVLLDVIGPGQFTQWSDNASTRRDIAVARLKDIRSVRPLRKLLSRMAAEIYAHRASATPRYVKSSWYTAAEFERLVVRARKIIDKKRTNRDIFGREIAYEEAVKFLLGKLPQEQKLALQRTNDSAAATVKHWAWWSQDRIFWLFTSLNPIALLIFLLDYTLIHLSLFLILISLTGSWISKSSDWRDDFGLSVTRVTTGTQLRLARMALTLIGPKKDGWRLRIIALIAFIVGSMLDLIASW